MIWDCKFSAQTMLLAGRTGRYMYGVHMLIADFLIWGGVWTLLAWTRLKYLPLGVHAPKRGELLPCSPLCLKSLSGPRQFIDKTRKSMWAKFRLEVISDSIVIGAESTFPSSSFVFHIPSQVELRRSLASSLWKIEVLLTEKPCQRSRIRMWG